jgi:hypothetical protein
VHRHGFAFFAGWFALISPCGLERALDLEKKLKTRAAAMVSLGSFVLALVPPSG